ncbi:LuxR C-terminal-related transcriptional regulator [Ahrensia marina]|uniref:helix-turn-helix transcriptional regulator n=1 Tax=Ahrensia marina TaxID=1514904 RepID=UPI0035D0E628
MNSDRLVSTVSAFEQSQTAQDVVEVFVHAILTLGFQGFVAADIDMQDRWKLLLYTSMYAFFKPLDGAAPWWSDDPVAARLATGEVRPFRVEDAWANPLPSAKDRWDYIVASGYGQGWVLPTAKPGYAGGIVLFSQNNGSARQEQDLQLGELHLLASYFHAFVTERDPDPDDRYFIRNTLGIRSFKGRKAHLAPREIACLRWCAFGKTADEIAYLENISVHTVRQYLKLAMRKLDSKSQAQAVARGLTYGLFKI